MKKNRLNSPAEPPIPDSPLPGIELPPGIKPLPVPRHADRVFAQRIDELYRIAMQGWRDSQQPLETVTEKISEGKVVSRKTSHRKAVPNRQLLKLGVQLAFLRKELAERFPELDENEKPDE